MDEEEQEEMRSKQLGKRAKRPPETDRQEEETVMDKIITKEPANKNKTKSVLFVPYTNGSILAKRLRRTSCTAQAIS